MRILIVVMALMMGLSSVELVAAMAQNTPKSSREATHNLPPKGKAIGFYLSRGGRLVETGRYTEAIAFLDAALAAPRKGVKPAVIKLAETLRRSAEIYEQARQFREMGNAEAAVAKYREIMKLNPADPHPLEFIVEVYDLLSEAAEKRGDYQEAARLYGEWYQANTNNKFPLQNQIKILKLVAQKAEEKRDYQLAVKTYQQLVPLEPDNPQPLRRIKEIERSQAIEDALAQSANLNADGAIKLLSSALSLYPDEQRLSDALQIARIRREQLDAETLMQKHQYHEAMAVYQRLLMVLPAEKPKIDAKLAEIRLRTGDDYQSDGVVRLDAQVNSGLQLRISGNKLVILNGEPNAAKVISGHFPSRLFNVKFSRISGDAQIQTIESPNRGNNYAITLQIVPKKDAQLQVDIGWELQTSGIVTWRGRVNGEVLVRLQGPFIDFQGNAQSVSLSADPLPHELYTINIDKTAGSTNARVRLIDSPSAANDYATTLLIVAQNEEVELHLEWIMDRAKRGR